MNTETIKASENKFKFPGQGSDEKVVLVIRKHKIVLLPYFLQLLALSFMPMLFYNLAVPAALPAFLEAPYNRILFLAYIVFYGFIWIGAFIVWVDYYLDVCIVTDKRILSVEQIGFFHRVTSELNLNRIQEMTSEVRGMFQTMFGFGDVYIQTAAEERKLTLKSIPHPVTTRKAIADLCAAAKERDRLIFRDREE